MSDRQQATATSAWSVEAAADDGSQEAVSLARHRDILLSRAPVVLLGVLIGLLTALAFLWLAPVTHTATTQVNVSVISTDPFSTQRAPTSLLDGTTEAEIAQSFVVADLAAKSLGGEMSAPQVQRAVSVDSVADTTLIRISFKASSDALARQGADAVAEAYLEHRSTLAEDRLSVLQDGIGDRLDTLREQLSEANARAARAKSGTGEANDAKSEQQSLTAEISSLSAQKNSLDTVDTTGGYVVTPSSQAAVSRFPTPLLAILSGLFLGLVVGVVAAHLVNARDRRLRTPTDVARVTGAPVLAHIPGTVASIPAQMTDNESFRVARERVLAELGSHHQVLTVIDDTRSSGLSDVGINLAHSFAQTGNPVQLILTGMTADLTQVVAQELSFRHTAQPDEWVSNGLPGFRMYSAVPDQSIDAADAFVTTQVRARISSVSDALVVVVLPPGAGQSSLLAAGRLSDACVLVAALGSSEAATISGSVAAMSSVHTPLLGSVTVPPQRRFAPEPSAVLAEGWQL